MEEDTISQRYPLRIVYLLGARWLEQPQNFYEEAVSWKRLEHPNIVPLLGITITSSPHQLVSGWISGGNLTEYIKNNSAVDQLGLVGASPASNSCLTYSLKDLRHHQRPRVPPFQ